MHRIQRKPSNETLASMAMDSTLDSRMSSAEVPQMELLKVNYVHQCKEAFMTKTGSSSPSYSYMEYKRNLPPPPVVAAAGQRKNVNRVTVNRYEAPNKPLPPPPLPTVESWQFLQNSSKNGAKFVKQSTPLERYAPEDATAPCCQSSSCDTGCESDTTLSGDGVKSNSWNYRDRISTCDIRRDIARAGIKSRADRIARIERTECEHSSHPKEVQERHGDITPTSPKEVVAKINQMFEQHKQKQVLPPQPKRPAPVPHKEPNRRLKPLQTSAEDHLRFKPSSKVSSECSECLSAQEGATNSSCSEASCPLDSGRYRRKDEPKERKPQSRIPKPIQETKSPPTPPLPLPPSQRQEFYKRSEDTFQNEASRIRPAVTVEHQLLRNPPRNGAGSQYPKSKVERVHIRKKRQPLLIINQLNEPAKEEKEQLKLERQTCGYKNCNFSQCPMSKSQHDLHHRAEADEDVNKLKRLSLESNSDSGVSSSNDSKEELKKSSANLSNLSSNSAQLKNLERCSDGKGAVKALTKSEHFSNYAYDKYKLGQDYNSDADLGKQDSKKGSQIKIHGMGKSITNFTGHYNNADPNDVTNFAKKNLTKATTHEALNNSMAKSLGGSTINSMSGSNTTITSTTNTTKQCNIENEQRLKFQNSLQSCRNLTTNIKIDDDWVKEDGHDHDDDFIEADSLMICEKSLKKPINCNDNAVKIFVRSSSQNNHDVTRSSCLSANSFVSQTSVCTQNSTQSSCSSASSCSSSTVSSSGCSGSSNADTRSLCDSERGECCCQFATANGMYFNHPSVDEQRACAGSPLSSTDAISDISSCVTCSTAESTVVDKSLVPLTAHNNSSKAVATCCNADSGIFWNNSYMSLDGQEANEAELPCCCSLSSCDDDNCSYYEGEGRSGGMNSSSTRVTGDNVKIEITHSYQARGKQQQQQHPQQLQLQLRNPHQQQQQQKQQQQLQPPKLPKRNVRMSSGEEMLIRNQLLRKTDVIHELRPRSMDGVVDSGVSLNGDNGCSSDAGESQQDCEARRLKRGHVLSELLETERIYVSEMSSILKGYCDQMHSEEMIHLVPASLQGKEDILFGNLHELYTFHNDIFLKDLENCISTTELVALCFVQRRDTFYRLYSFYCQNIPRSDRLRETLVDTHLFLQECQKRLGHKLPLAAYLLKPVQRITKYQLLLKDLLRFSDSGSCTKELQKALDCMLIVLKCVNDSMHQVAITGFPTDLSQQGELLLQDSFQIWSESKKDIRLRIKPQQRHIFLYQKSMLFCKQTSKPGHNKSTYQFKHYLKMSQIGLTESVRGDTKRFEVWLQGRQEVHTLQAPTLEIKNKWVAEIKKVLLNQLEELKGEKIKQYGLNHRGLRQTTSWDTPNILLGTPQRTISCDASSESSNRNSNCSSSDDNCTTVSIGSAMPISSNVSMISGSSTINAAVDKEHNEACGWSSDYSNSEDEMSMAEENNSTPRFINFLAPWSTTTTTTTSNNITNNTTTNTSSTTPNNGHHHHLNHQNRHHHHHNNHRHHTQLDNGSYPQRNSKSNSKFYVSVEH